MEDPLDDAGMIQQQLDQLSTIGGCEYDKTCGLIVRLFDDSATAYQELLSNGQTQASIQVTIQEGTSAKLKVICLTSHVCTLT